MAETGTAVASSARSGSLRNSEAATDSEMNAWLGEVMLLTARRKEDDDDLAARLHVYTRRLSEYPKDMVRAVLREWPNRNKFFPTWCELKAALYEMHPKPDRAVACLPRPELTPEERAERKRRAEELKSIAKRIGAQGKHK